MRQWSAALGRGIYPLSKSAFAEQVTAWPPVSARK